MRDNAELVKQVSEITGIQCRPASNKDLKTLRELGMPERMVDFYARYEPERAMEYGPCIRTIREIERLCEITHPRPFAAGFIPFGDEMNGDTLCVFPEIADDDGWPLVMVLAHERLPRKPSDDEIFECADQYCENLPAVLEKMIANHERRNSRSG